MKNLVITLDTPIDEEKILLKHEESMLFATNTLSCIVGEAKSRKSFFKDLLISKMFNNPSEGFSGDFSGRCLVIDTEQSTRWVVQSLKRLKEMGVDVENRLTMLAVKQFSPRERLKYIEQYIQEVQPEVVIIDGVRDLVKDFNNLEESTNLVNELMRFINDYNIHINTVLHLNPGSDKARGHLGTEFLNKCDAVLKVQTQGKGDGARTKVSSVAMRDKDINPIYFKVINGIPTIE